MDKTDDRPVLKEPIYLQQPEETDRDYALFLFYRECPWDVRTLRMATAVATGVPLKDVKSPHSMMIHGSAKWQWSVRADAYDLMLQENRAEQQEKIVLRMKFQVEHSAMKIVEKINRLVNIENAEDLGTPESRRDMAIIQAMIPEGGAAKFMLDAYKTILGQKIAVGPMKQLPRLGDWVEV